MKKNVVGFFKDNKLLTGLYFVFVFLLCTTTYVGFSGNVEQFNIKVKSVTPEYDESSTIVMNGNDVIFNDKDQEVKYKVVLENTEGHNLSVSSVDLTTPTESFLSYTIDNLKKDDVIKANSTKEVTVSLKTTAVEGWGRNFNDELTANITFAKNLGTGSTNQNVESPETGDGIVLAVLIAATSATGLAILIVSKKKFVKYMVLTLMLSPALTLVKADTTIQLPITIKASFESQNVMKTAMDESGNFRDYWAYSAQIKNCYILNEITAMPGELVEKFDVSNDGNERVMAYLLENPPGSSMYDLYLQAEGVIYPNTDASYYFYGMEYLEKIENIEGLDVSKVTDMSSMFHFTGYYSSSFILDLGEKFDTSNVVDMRSMFDNIAYNNENFTLNLGDKFDTSNVTDMSGMFVNTGYFSQLFTLDLGDKFDTSNVTDMGNMFSSTGYACSNFTLNLGDKFDTSNVTNMGGMFDNTGYESTIFILDLGEKFDIGKVTNMNGMFNNTGYNSSKLNISITIKNLNPTYMSVFNGIATKEGTKVTVNYTSETEELVKQMIATKSAGSNVELGNLIVDADNLSVGDEIHISGEKFNVISQTDDTVSMLAKYNLGTNYKQSATQNSTPLSEDFIWRSDSNEIDIQSLTSGLKTYVNNYVAYLKDVLGVEDIIGNLISLNELNNLECDVNIEEPIDVNNCINSQHSGWLVNGQYWYTRTGYPEMYDKVFHFAVDGYVNAISTDNPSGVRPVITISKDTLRNLGK